MSVKIIDTLKPKNNGSFPIVEAVDVAVSEELRLPEALEAKADASALAATDAAVATKANAADVSTATAQLQGEIDQIIISSSAESVVAPEVASARVDSNGVSYQTLKARIDANYSDLDYKLSVLPGLGYVEKTIISPAGQAHSSNSDMVDFTVNAGDVLYVTIVSTGTESKNVELRGKPAAGGSTESIGLVRNDGKVTRITASSDYVKIGFYINAFASDAKTTIIIQSKKFSPLFEQEFDSIDSAILSIAEIKDSSNSDVKFGSGGNMAPNNRIFYFGEDEASSLPVKKNDTIVITGDLRFDLVTYINGNSSETGFLYTPFYFKMPADGKMRVVFSKPDGSSFENISDADGLIKVFNNVDDKIAQVDGRVSDVDSRLVYSPTAEETGATLGTGGGLTPNNRLLFYNSDNKLVLKKGGFISFDSSGDIEVALYIETSGGTVDSGWLSLPYTFTADTDTLLRVTFKHNSGGAFDSVSDMDGNVHIGSSSLQKEIIELYSLIPSGEELNEYLPDFYNGSLNNSGNQSAVCTKFIMPTYGATAIRVTVDAEIEEGLHWNWLYRLFTVSEGRGQTGQDYVGNDKLIANYDQFAKGKTTFVLELPPNCKGYCIGIVKEDDENTWYSVQNEEFYNGAVSVARIFENPQNGSNADKYKHLISNARHKAAHPLTLLHFSDIHGDANALSRIMSQYEDNSQLFNDVICTGDIVANTSSTAADLPSWWDERIMTCIGNHDSAISVPAEQGYYDWTGLSMADRDNYYIKPFEDNWDIVHTSGTSYYYKDYDDSNIRLIVIDIMLYSDDDQTEANTQTSWLGNVIDDAMQSDYHVLIAAHAPHEQSIPVNCSFSKYGEVAMPLQSDCHMPFAVTNLVASKIEDGLDFIGYLVGHTHQDNIWDCTGDRTQLAYCVTCAAVSQNAQWINSDQHRSSSEDAYNIVTVDSDNHIIKIIRGGGADIDRMMRDRKYISIDYSSGTIISE